MRPSKIIKKIHRTLLKRILIFALIFFLGTLAGYSYFVNFQKTTSLIREEKNNPKAFISEIYDKIRQNYWNNLSDAQLIDQFRLAISKNAGQPLGVNVNSKDKLVEEVLDMTKGMNDEQRNKFVVNIIASVLASLNPPGRSGLFTQKQEEQLKNTVSNINPDKDLYKDLGLSKGASESAVKEAFEQKHEELSEKKTPEAQEELKQISYAKDVLTQKDNKERYDQGGIEPTIFSKITTPGILYLQFKKFSPSSLDEFIKTFDTYKDDLSLYGLIFDLRGNVGGAIDATAYLLGYFIGLNQYAFDFYHQGEYLPFKTPTSKLPSVTKYKQVVILVDNQTQSSAEMMAATFKKYHLGVVVGVPTKGWGTVERVFPLDNQIDKSTKYSMFLVHSITLREDNQPIEGRGVDPDINISNTNWPGELFSYFRNNQLVEAVKSLL